MQRKQHSPVEQPQNTRVQLLSRPKGQNYAKFEGKLSLFLAFLVLCDTALHWRCRNAKIVVTNKRNHLLKNCVLGKETFSVLKKGEEQLPSKTHI